MQGTDDRILEYLRDHYWGTPETIYVEIDRAQKWVQKRLTVLENYGMVDRPARGVYVPNDNTIAYLDEKLDASELEPRED